jgi:hypothetical protein
VSHTRTRLAHRKQLLIGATFAAAAGLGAFVACGDDGPSGVTCDMPGAAVAGAADTHCDGMPAVTVDQAECSPPDAGPTTPDAGPETGDDFGATLFNAEGDDDDCKYHFAWTSTTLCQNGDVYFTLTGTTRSPVGPMLGADPYIEAFLTDTPSHVVPNSDAKTVELGGGKYKIGPIHFDAPGKWTVRFHVYATCADGEASPHGHGAFFVTLK